MASDSMDMSLRKLRELVMDREGGLVCCSPWGHKELDNFEYDMEEDDAFFEE